jgi:hypothetical protein
MNWKGYGKKHSWPNLRHYPDIFLKGLRKTTKSLCQDCQSLDQVNVEPPEYEVCQLLGRSFRLCGHIKSPSISSKNRMQWLMLP